ncbi:MAG: hypothetical protein ACOYNS_17785 [Bacteroidota bacterium]
MQTYLIEAAVVLSLIYEYRKRKKAHILTIAGLKEGIMPEDPVIHKDLLGIILVSTVTILFIGFLVYITFFFPITVHPLLLAAPYGIAVSMLMLGRRDLLLYRQQQKEKR